MRCASSIRKTFCEMTKDPMPLRNIWTAGTRAVKETGKLGRK
jgi:hypothetical protein